MLDDEKEVHQERRKQSYTRLAMEVILRAFNDILSNEYYQYHTTKYLRHKDYQSQVILKKHHDAIDWFLNHRDNVWFDYLKLTLTREQIMKAIHSKFNSPRKFNKYYACFASETGVNIDAS